MNAKSGKATTDSLDALSKLKGQALVDAERFVILFLLRRLCNEAENPTVVGRKAAEAAVTALSIGVTLLESKSIRTNILSVAATMTAWPTLFSPSNRDVEILRQKYRLLGVGRRCLRNPASRAKSATSEVKWADWFITRAYLATALGQKALQEAIFHPVAWCQPLAKLPPFDGTEKTFRIWEEACWADAKRRYPYRTLGVHPDWRHLPGAKQSGHTIRVPESRIRDRLKRALRQGLNFSRE